MADQSSKPTRKRTRRNTRSLGWNDEQIGQAAAVGPEDADAVSAWFDRFAPKAARTLLDAPEQEPGVE